MYLLNKNMCRHLFYLNTADINRFAANNDTSKEAFNL